MRTPSLRLGIVIATLLILVTFLGLLAWRATVWDRTGTLGMMYHPATDDNNRAARELGWGVFRQNPGEIAMVVPGLGADRAGLEVGDRILTIEGIPIDEQEDLHRLTERKRTGDRLEFRIERGEEERFLRVPLVSPFASRRVVLSIVSNTIVGLAFLTISLLVFRLRSESQRARVFYFATMTGALFFFAAIFNEVEIMGSGLAAGEYQFRRMMTVLPLYGVLSVVMVSLLLHLALVFPRERPILLRHPRLPVLMHAAPLVPAIGCALGLAGLAMGRRNGVWLVAASAIAGGALLLALVRRGRPVWRAALDAPWLAIGSIVLLMGPLVTAPISFLSKNVAIVLFAIVFLGSLMLWPFAIAIVYMVLACVALYRSYRESGVEEKRQVRWPLWGTIVALSVTALYGIVILVLLNVSPSVMQANQTPMVIASLVVKACFLLIPLSFAFGILKYRLMDIDLIIRKTVIYAGVTAVVLAAYLLLVGGIGTAVVRVAAVENQTVVVVATLAIAAGLVPVRNRVQHFVDRRFFRSRFDYAETLENIRQRTSAVMTLEETLAFAAERIQQAMQTRTAALFLKEPGEPFAPVATVGVSDRAREETRLPWGADTFAGADGAVRLAALPLGEGDRRRLEKFDAAALAPIRGRDAVAGFVLVGHPLRRDDFEAEDLEFLSAVAALLAPAIEIERGRREQREFQQAREIQRALLPSTVPQPPGFEIAGFSEPARAVGGDYFDALDLGGSTTAICIADVCGKGMTAALMMSGLQAAVRSLSTPDTEPAELVTRVRRVVCSNLSAGKFITFFYAVLHPDGRLAFTNAGHNYPILARADGSVERLRDGGPVLGRLFAERELRQGEVLLRPGDRVVLFTDGVSEARDPAEEEFGEDRLADLVASAPREGAEALRRRIVDEVSRFTSGNFHDDVTLVIVERRA